MDESKEEPRNLSELHEHWTQEFASATEAFKIFHEKGDKVVDKFLDRSSAGEDEQLRLSKLNLFHSNVTTLTAMLYGNTPKAEVSRTFADPKDDVARVAAEIITRMINQDIEQAGQDQISVLQNVLQDRLLPGVGSARVRYEHKSESKTTPAILDDSGNEVAPAINEDIITDEWVDIDYIHWKDLLWSPARTYSEIRWKAYRSYLSKENFTKRFGEEKVKLVSFTSKGNLHDDKTVGQKGPVNPEVEVWEIWDKTKREVLWFVKGSKEVLDVLPDTLELDSFFPDPPPLIANATTSKFMPKSDYEISQDLYREIDYLQTRISILTEACKLVGVYDKANEGIKRLFKEGFENDLIPIDNWASFSEKGGLEGAISWVPLEEVVNTISVLTDKQNEKIQQLYQITGMSDILRGASQPYEAAATSKEKVKYASIRVQALQDEFARFASDLQSLKMEIIQKHFQPYCILQQSNIMATEDAQYAQDAVALLKDREKAAWKIRIRPETLAMADYAQIKADRMEYINGLAMFMQSAAPLAEMDKSIVPTLLKLLQWGLAGFKGSSEVEGVLDAAIDEFTKKAQQPEQPKPDPAMEKAKIDIQKTQMEMQQSKEEHEANMQMQQQKYQMEMEQSQQEFQLKISEMQQKFALEMKILVGELKASIIEKQMNVKEQQTISNINQEEKTHAAAVQMVSDREKASRDSAGDDK